MGVKMRGWVLILACGLLAAGCARPPVQSIQSADAALLRLKSIQAHETCPDLYRSAEMHLKAAKTALERKAYELAKTEVIESLRLANQARACTENAAETAPGALPK